MTGPRRSADRELQVLIFAPIGRDAELTRELLARAEMPCLVSESIERLVETLETASAGALLLTEESLDDRRFESLAACLAKQPPWSDIPILLFAGGPGVDITVRAIRSIDRLRNVTLLERPIRLAAVLSAVRAALRSRTRQYEVRDLLAALDYARAEAEGANRLKDEFLATLSHELRTPLNAILGWTSMLARGQIHPNRFPRVFDALDRNAQAQAQLIGDVLDVSRIVTGKLQLQPTLIDLAGVVGRAVEAVSPSATSKRIRVTLDAPADCAVHGDPDRLQQVFWNLLSNAIKFTPVGGSVQVAITNHAGAITVAIVDSGVGIAPEFVPFVFDRFRQADQTTTREHGGLGLGLSIVKQLTELHGGTVTASSDGPGRGARFDIRLPAAERPSRSTERTAGAPVGVRLHGEDILVVDDDAATRDVVAAALEAAAAQVHVAASAAEARAWLERHTPALIIADLGMPVEDGFSLIRGIRQSAAASAPAIAFSAYADPASRAAALAAGFTAFLAKPASPQTLLALVASLLRTAAVRRA